MAIVTTLQIAYLAQISISFKRTSSRLQCKLRLSLHPSVDLD